MSNVLDLYDQTYFSFERAAGVTNLLQCVWVYNRAIDIDGLRRFHQHLQQGLLSRRIERSPLPFGRHRWVSPSGQSELEIAATPRPREEFDAWLDEQANTPLDAEHGPGWHLAVLPFTDGGAGAELGRLPLPHRRRRALRGVGGRGFRPPRPDQLACCWVAPAVAGPARGRPPNRTRHPRVSAAPSSPQRDSPGVTAAVTERPPRRRSCPPEPTNVSLFQRQRSSSTPTNGTPAHSRSGGPATRCLRDWRPASPSEWDGSPQTARSPRRYPSTSAPPAIPAPTPSRMSTSRSTLHPQRPTCARSGPQPSKR